METVSRKKIEVEPPRKRLCVNCHQELHTHIAGQCSNGNTRYYPEHISWKEWQLSVGKNPDFVPSNASSIYHDYDEIDFQAQTGMTRFEWGISQR